MKNEVTAERLQTITQDLHQHAGRLNSCYIDTLVILEDIKAVIKNKFTPEEATENDTITPDSILDYLWSKYQESTAMLRHEIDCILLTSLIIKNSQDNGGLS